jgi:hypothetical protein
LNPQQLGELTYAEFLDLHDGFLWRERRQKEMLALLASWTTAPHVKKPISPDKFLGDNHNEETKKKTTPEQANAVVNELAHMMGVQNGNN